MSVETKILPSQYVVVRATGASKTKAYQLDLAATDPVNNEDFEATGTGKSPVFVRIGPFRKGGTVAIEYALTDLDAEGGPTVVETGTATVVVVNANSPAVIVRQGLYDVLAAANLPAVVLHDPWGRPDVIAEDMPWAASQLALEIGPAATTARKVSPARWVMDVSLSVQVFALGYGTVDGLTAADNLAFLVQQAVDRSGNLRMGSLGINDFTWQWRVQPPQVNDVDGSTIPVITQEMEFSVPVIWVAS